MAENKMENKMDKVESLLKWLVSGEKDEDGNWLSDDDTQLVCDALEYYLNMHGQKNKMEQVAKMFGKELDERFTICRDNEKFDAMFMLNGLLLMGAYENPYIDVDAFVLRDLLIGEAEIVEDKK